VKLALLLATAAAIAPASQPPVPAPVPVPAVAAMPVPDAPPPVVRLAGFAPRLAQTAPLVSPAAWAMIGDDVAWRAIARSSGVGRQQARWDYARSLIGRGRGAEAVGVLDVMAADDPDLALVDAWRIAHGAALVLLDRPAEAAEALAGNGLDTNPEACAWRLRALAAVAPGSASGLLDCARPAILARSGESRTPFVTAAAGAALEGNKPQLALDWLARLPDRNPAANLYRARADALLGRGAEARLRLGRVEESGNALERVDARLSMIEIGAANGWLTPAVAIDRLAALRYTWRGGPIEQRALRLGYRLADKTNDLDEALRTGATLFRFYDIGGQGADFVPALQAKLASALEPGSSIPLIRAAGLFWDYRDLMPSGAAGDLMVSKLGARLQSAGLYERAAELFEHQLLIRAVDLAQGPLSVKVATLYILAGRPDRALIAMRKTAQVDYPDTMLFARKRVEAVALSQLGRQAEAFAVLQDVPDAATIRAEIAWHKRDWSTVAAETSGQLPAAGKLSEVGQAIVLRRAIALAMLGKEGELAVLHGRYAQSFARLPAGPAFAVLTARPGLIDPAQVAKAMAAMPSASPAGDIGELIDAGG
jgi:tetratricopeptide (TPR) repeat protein